MDGLVGVRSARNGYLGNRRDEMRKKVMKEKKKQMMRKHDRGTSSESCVRCSKEGCDWWNRRR